MKFGGQVQGIVLDLHTEFGEDRTVRSRVMGVFVENEFSMNFWQNEIRHQGCRASLEGSDAENGSSLGCSDAKLWPEDARRLP